MQKLAYGALDLVARALIGGWMLAYYLRRRRWPEWHVPMLMSEIESPPKAPPKALPKEGHG